MASERRNTSPTPPSSSSIRLSLSQNNEPAPSSDSPTSPHSSQQEVCKFYLKGQCNRGNKCAYLHPPNVVVAQPTLRTRASSNRLKRPKTPLPANQALDVRPTAPKVPLEASSSGPSTTTPSSFAPPSSLAPVFNRPKFFKQVSESYCLPGPVLDPSDSINQGGSLSTPTLFNVPALPLAPSWLSKRKNSANSSSSEAGPNPEVALLSPTSAGSGGYSSGSPRDATSLSASPHDRPQQRPFFRSSSQSSDLQVEISGEHDTTGPIVHSSSANTLKTNSKASVITASATSSLSTSSHPTSTSRSSHSLGEFSAQSQSSAHSVTSSGSSENTSAGSASSYGSFTTPAPRIKKRMNTGTALTQPAGFSSSQVDLASSLGGSLSALPSARGKRFSNKSAMMRWTQNFTGPGCDPTSVLLKRDELVELLQEPLPFAVIAELIRIFTHHEFRDTGRTERIVQLVANSPLIRNPKNLKAYIIKLSGVAPPASIIYEENFSNLLTFISDIMERYPHHIEILGLDLLQITSEKIRAAYPKDLYDASQALIAAGKEVVIGPSANTSGGGLNEPSSVSSLAFSRNPDRTLKSLQEFAEFDDAASYGDDIELSYEDSDDEDGEARSTAEREGPSTTDFRDLPLFPTIDEIMDESDSISKGVSKNLVKGKYDNLGHYLDTHFRLLREDAITSIRDGIKAYRSGLNASSNTDEFPPSNRAPKPSDISVYKDARLTGICPTLSGIVYRVTFKLDSPGDGKQEKRKGLLGHGQQVDWSRSKKLLYGSLVCLSPNNFNTLYWATVANRDIHLLSTSQEIDLRFVDDGAAFVDPGQTYTMVESNSTYFEAYRHVLTALKTTNTRNFPFLEYFINCESNIDIPSYLHTTNSIYDMSGVFEGPSASRFDILDPNWTNGRIQTNMDESQLDAVKEALTKEVAVIQGPPGTGKTFVGLKVMRALLDNRELRGVGNIGPIMIVCYTNHALDQFLEGILEFEPNVIRIGSRSKSELLKDKNMKSLIYETNAGPAEHNKARRQLLSAVKELQETIETCFMDLSKVTLSASEISQVCYDEEQITTLFGDSVGTEAENSVLESWLGVPPREILREIKAQPDILAWSQQLSSPILKSIPGTPSSTASFPSASSRASLSSASSSSSSSTARTSTPVPSSSPAPPMSEWCEEDDSEDEFLEQAEELDRMVGESFSLKMTQLKSESMIMSGTYEGQRINEATRSCPNVWKLTRSERHRLYVYWLVSFRRRIVNPNMSELCDRYEQLIQQKQVLDQDAQVQLLMSSAVIGLTTTGVAKFQKLIRAVGPPIVIVEEAAEVLEAHIVTALTPSTKHMILIGDHEQLRPSTAVYRLALKYKLDVSLFERLIKNGFPVKTLSRQRRMRPEISQLIAPIYPMLTDHPDTQNRTNIQGVARNVFFIDHNMPESADTDSQGMSKTNPHEATFLARLTAHLILQGYHHNQVTILTAYSGQAKLIRQELKRLDMGDVYVTSVDNFQGQECDVICLSLVRNNAKGTIGFLNTSNRICVALSRARIGLYIMGNAPQLAAANALWKTIVDALQSSGSIGPSLPLQCQQHHERITQVASSADFAHAEDGGCDLKCEQLLECGHMCPRLCHPYPHCMVLCQQQCEKVHKECGHQCTRRCSQECGDCEVQVTRTLPCGHECTAPCFEHEPLCAKLIDVTLPCSHTITALCREVTPSTSTYNPKPLTCPTCSR